jgi:protocatechuate 3,4-dioxygenase beta subunit
MPSEASVQVTISQRTLGTKITITEPTSGQTVYAGEPFWVRGKLTDEAGNPLAGMSVDLYLYNNKMATATTASDGSFAFQAIIETTGTQTVTLKFPGASTATTVYQASQASVSVNVVLRGIGTRITITEPKQGQTIPATQVFYVKGTLTDQNGNALAGMTVNLYINDKYTNSATTASDGSFSFAVAIGDPGTYTIKVRFEGAQGYPPSGGGRQGPGVVR